MENFYVTYDATDSENLKIGLSHIEVEDAGHSTLLTVIVIILAALIMLLFVALFVCICCRERRMKRLEQAKSKFAKFDMSKSEGAGDKEVAGGFKVADVDEDDPEREFLDSAKKQEDLESIDPNALLAKKGAPRGALDDTSSEEEEEARDQVPEDMTANEMAVGSLL